jgi:hypothetical protein
MGRVQELANYLGVRLAEVQPTFGLRKPALIGTARYGAQLRAAGARWDRAHQVLVFQDWEALQSALDSLVQSQRLSEDGANGPVCHKACESGAERSADSWRSLRASQPCRRAQRTTRPSAVTVTKSMAQAESRTPARRLSRKPPTS